MQRVVDCGHMQTPICNSDHTGIKLTLRTEARGGSRTGIPRSSPALTPRQELAQRNRAELETEEGRKAFNDKCNASTDETIANGGTCIEAIWLDTA
jgi:hypothetical protein